MDFAFIASLLATGALAGLLAGLLGLGGGTLLVPALTFLLSWRGLEPSIVVHAAIATSMAYIVLSSVSSVIAHHEKGAVRWELVAAFSPGIFIGALLASAGVFSSIKAGWLSLLFAGFVGISGIQMLVGHKPTPSRTMPNQIGTGAVGAGIGFMSGLVGIGGGIFSVPFMTWRNIPLRQAVGTSAALGFPIALFNTLGYVWSGMQERQLPEHMLGFVYWPALLALATFGIVLAPVGAKLAHRLPVKLLKRVFAYFLLGLALYMVYKAYSAFSS